MINQYGSTLDPEATMEAAPAMNKNPEPISMMPMANFAGADGLRLRFAKAIHNHARNGANMKMNAESSDWNQPVGMTKCNHSKVRLVYRSANRFKPEPACS